MHEKWKDLIIPELDNYKIKVSNLGTIQTYKSKTIRKDGKALNRNGRILKPAIDNYGYERITLCNKNLRKSYYVHRLIARTFLSNYSDSLQVNHINGNKRDNNINNLEMVTLQENIKHSIITGLKPKLLRDKKGRFYMKEVV